MDINPYQAPGKPGWRVTFRNPYLNGKLTTKGLDTRDETEARAVANDINALSTRRDLWQAAESPELLAYDYRAVAAFFGKDSPHALFIRGQTPSSPVAEVEEAEALALVQANADMLKELTRETGADAPAVDAGAILARIPAAFFKRYRELSDRCTRYELDLKALRPRNAWLETRLAKYERAANLHAKISVIEAMKAFEPALKVDRKPKTIAEIRDAMDAFKASLPEKGRERLGDIRAGHVDEFLTTVKTKDGSDPSARTRQKRRAGLSVFFTWATKKYELAANPMTGTDRIKAAGRAMDAVVAIDRLEDLQDLLTGLKAVDAYWHAWVSVACLAGPRWNEQRHLTLDDVKLDEGFILVKARKTGRIRRVPIERTYLRAVLEAHLKARKAEQKKPTMPGHATPWLFPTTLEDNIYKPRTKTAPGLWSDGDALHNAFDRVRDEARERKLFKPAWAHGPREWRHTFGTALGMCGLSNMQIAEMMGNSPEIARRFYVASALPPRPWPFVWLGTEPGARKGRDLTTALQR